MSTFHSVLRFVFWCPFFSLLSFSSATGTSNVLKLHFFIVPHSTYTSSFSPREDALAKKAVRAVVSRRNALASEMIGSIAFSDSQQPVNPPTLWNCQYHLLPFLSFLPPANAFGMVFMVIDTSLQYSSTCLCCGFSSLDFDFFLSLDSVIYTVVRENILTCSPDEVKPLLEIFNKLPSPGENPQAPQTQSSGSCLTQAYCSGHSLFICCPLPSPVHLPSPQEIFFLHGGATFSFFTVHFKQD